MTPSLILYHNNCPDGTAAAWCYLHLYPGIECIGVTHNQPPPDVTNRNVVIVDFSYKREVLEAMHTSSTSLLVLDHHISAQRELEGLSYCTFDMNKSGCELAWEALHGDKEKPYFLQAIADHDVWRKVPDSEAITRYLRQCNGNNFENYTLLYEEGEKGRALLIAEGEMLLKKDAATIASFLKNTRLYTMKDEDYIVRIGVAPAKLVSEFGEAMNLEGDCDFSISYIYSWEQGEWWLSLRSLKESHVDVAAIAKKYFGGGGHVNAAGGVLREKDGQLPSQYFKCI